MPAKIKWVWVLCSLFIFFGFLYFSVKAGIKEAEIKERQAWAARMKKAAPPVKKFKEKTSQISRKIKDIRELIALGKYDEATTLARDVVEKDPKNAQAHSWWGISLVKTQQLDKAVEKFLQASQLDPNQTRTFLYWGLTLSMQKKYQEAIAKYEMVIQLDPENSNAYAYLGGALAGLQNHKKAIAPLQKALNLNPFNETAYGVLVDSLYHTEQYGKAWEAVFSARKHKTSIVTDSLERLRLAMPEPVPGKIHPNL